MFAKAQDRLVARFLTRVTRAEQAFLVMDQATRDAYDARATAGGDN
jgi:hypothetical protein